MQEKAQLTLKITETMFDKFKQALAGDARITLRKNGTIDAFQPEELARSLIGGKFPGVYDLRKSIEEQALPRIGSLQLMEALRRKLQSSEVYENALTGLTQWFQQLRPETSEAPKLPTGFSFEAGSEEVTIKIRLDDSTRSIKVADANGASHSVVILPEVLTLRLNQFLWEV